VRISAKEGFSEIFVIPFVIPTFRKKTMKTEGKLIDEQKQKKKKMKSRKKTVRKGILSRKEKEELVKRLYEQGYTYRDIAKELRISVRDISRILRSEERKDEIDEIKERLNKLEEEVKGIGERVEGLFDVIDRCFDVIDRLDERLDNASSMVRHALGNAKIKIRCPHCH